MDWLAEEGKRLSAQCSGGCRAACTGKAGAARRKRVSWAARAPRHGHRSESGGEREQLRGGANRALTEGSEGGGPAGSFR